MWMMLLFFLYPSEKPLELEIKTLLSDFHKAASDADGDRYFSMLAPNAVFLGTDGTERWDKASFYKLYGPYMASGKGWTFTPTQQWVTIGPGKQVAWFDEALSSEHYGPTRGSGVLVRIDGHWKIAQYNLSIPMPNDLAKSFVGIIAAYDKERAQ